MIGFKSFLSVFARLSLKSVDVSTHISPYKNTDICKYALQTSQYRNYFLLNTKNGIRKNNCSSYLRTSLPQCDAEYNKTSLIYCNLLPLTFIPDRFFSVSQPSCSSSFLYIHRRGPILKKRRDKNPLGDKPMARGVILKVFTKKPKKPNSAKRKCVLLRLSTGREMTAYVPGEGHNLQEHNTVLVRVARLRDTPGVKLKCIRGVYDLPHVIKKQQL